MSNANKFGYIDRRKPTPAQWIHVEDQLAKVYNNAPVYEKAKLESQKQSEQAESKSLGESIEAMKRNKTIIHNKATELHKAYKEWKGCNKNEEKKKEGEFNEKKKAINAVVKPLLEALKYYPSTLNGNKDNEDDEILNEIDKKISKLQGEKEGHDVEIEKIKGRQEAIDQKSKKWKEDIRECDFVVTVVKEIGSAGDGKEYDEKDRGDF